MIYGYIAVFIKEKVMRHKIIGFLKVMFLLFWALNAQGRGSDVTIKQAIERTQFNGEAQALYIVGLTTWDSANCSPGFVYFTPSLSGYQEMLSMVMAAHMSGREVSFSGTCDPNNQNMFIADYLQVY